MVTAIARQLGRDRERRVNLSALWIIKLLRHHANDRSDNAIGLDCLIDNVRVAAEAALPQTVSEQGYSIFAWLILFSRETAAQQGLHADDIKKVGRDLKALHTLWRVGTGEVRAPPTIHSELLKGSVLGAPIKIIGDSNFVTLDSATRNLVPERDNTFGIGKRQRFE